MRGSCILFAVLVRFGLTAIAQAPNPAQVFTIIDFFPAGIDQEEAASYSDMFAAKVVQSGVFRVIDRSKLPAVLNEMEASLHDYSDQRYRQEIGSLLSASLILMGSIGRLGSWYIVSVHLVDVSTGQTMKSSSEKYPTREALVDGAGVLAERVIGKRIDPSSAASAGSTPSAAVLIPSVKQYRMKRQWEKQLQKVKADEYTKWLLTNGFQEYERTASIEEKTAFLEEYIYQTNTRGHGVDLFPSIGHLGSNIGAGLTTNWTYQFNSLFSVGVSTNVFLVATDPIRFGGASVGPVFVIGDKVELFAVSASIGFGADEGPAFPYRIGAYFKNFYIGYMGSVLLAADWALPRGGVEFGYSWFLGDRRMDPRR